MLCRNISIQDTIAWFCIFFQTTKIETSIQSIAWRWSLKVGSTVWNSAFFCLFFQQILWRSVIFFLSPLVFSTNFLLSKLLCTFRKPLKKVWCRFGGFVFSRGKLCGKVAVPLACCSLALPFLTCAHTTSLCLFSPSFPSVLLSSGRKLVPCN